MDQLSGTKTVTEPGSHVFATVPIEGTDGAGGVVEYLLFGTDTGYPANAARAGLFAWTAARQDGGSVAVGVSDHASIVRFSGDTFTFAGEVVSVAAEGNDVTFSLVVPPFDAGPGSWVLSYTIRSTGGHVIGEV